VKRLIAVLAVAFLATYLWSARYQYFPGAATKPRTLLVRVDRFTGRASALLSDGWHPCRPDTTLFRILGRDPEKLSTLHDAEERARDNPLDLPSLEEVLARRPASAESLNN